MKKVISVVMLYLLAFNAHATSVFYGSLYMLDQNGNGITNPQCQTCDSLSGEIDNNLSALVNINAHSVENIVGNNDFMDIGLGWSLTNLSFVINNDTTISLNGDFLWTNYNGLTSSSFSQLSQTLGANGEIIAIEFGVRVTTPRTMPTVCLVKITERVVTLTPNYDQNYSLCGTVRCLSV